MKKRRILIIHEAGLFRSILKRILIAEVPDVDLHTAASAKEGLKILEKDGFDMIISANEMNHLNGTDIYEKLKANPRHRETGFLLLTSKLDQRNANIFKNKGIANVLKTPFEAGQLAQAVEKLSHPREWRRHRRWEVPNTKVKILLEHGAIPAEVVNVSMGGMLCNIKVADGLPTFSKFYKLFLQFPGEYESAAVTAQGYVLRQAALHWFEPPRLEILQAAWFCNPFSESDGEILGTILDKVAADLSRQDEDTVGHF